MRALRGLSLVKVFVAPEARHLEPVEGLGPQAEAEARSRERVTPNTTKYHTYA